MPTDPTPSDADREVAREIEGPCFEYDRCNDTQEYAKCGVCVRADRIAQALATARAEERERWLRLCDLYAASSSVDDCCRVHVGELRARGARDE